MRVIAKKALREFWEAHPDAEASLLAWYKTASKAQWSSLADVKQVYSHADLVAPYTVFNIHGNEYRLIVKIIYKTQRIYINCILTHKDYDKGNWK